MVGFESDPTLLLLLPAFLAGEALCLLFFSAGPSFFCTSFLHTYTHFSTNFASTYAPSHGSSALYLFPERGVAQDWGGQRGVNVPDEEGKEEEV